MILKNFIFSFFLILFLLAFNKHANAQHTKTVVVSHVQQVEAIPLPPKEIKSDFKSLQEWMTALTKEKVPQKSIDEFQFGFFSSDSSITMYLVGANNHETEDYSSTTIGFTPKNMYYPLPFNKYKNLSWRQIQDTLSIQLKTFLNTEEFKNSFLAKANKITLNGVIIWNK